jgi:hypothetical protein
VNLLSFFFFFASHLNLNSQAIFATINYFVLTQRAAADEVDRPDFTTLSIHFAKGSFKDDKYKPIAIIIAAITIAVGILIFIIKHITKIPGTILSSSFS